jgi:hypothetical protein
MLEQIAIKGVFAARSAKFTRIESTQIDDSAKRAIYRDHARDRDRKKCRRLGARMDACDSRGIERDRGRALHVERTAWLQ